MIMIVVVAAAVEAVIVAAATVVFLLLLRLRIEDLLRPSHFLSVAPRFLIAKHFTSQLLKLCFPLLHLSPQTIITLDNSDQIDDRRLAFLRHLHFLHF